MKEQMRAEFEAWCFNDSPESPNFSTHRNRLLDYSSEQTDGAWHAWQHQQAKIDSLQAALAAVPAQEPTASDEKNAKRKSWTTIDWMSHVGAWETERDTIEFGSVMAVNAMLIQFQQCLLWQVSHQPAQEPYGYVTTLRNGTKHFYESMPYLNNAVKCEAVYLQPQQPVKQEIWLPIETAPKNTKIIVRYKNEYGNDKTVFAKYIERLTEESSCDSEMNEYDEATDTYYLKEGWLELIENWDEFSSVYFDSRNIVTGWMPAPPVEVKE